MDRYIEILLIAVGALALSAMAYWFFYNLAREKKLKEKEEKLLKLYLTFEDVVGEFGGELQQKKESIEDKLEQLEKRLDRRLAEAESLPEAAALPAASVPAAPTVVKTVPVPAAAAAVAPPAFADAPAAAAEKVPVPPRVPETKMPKETGPAESEGQPKQNSKKALIHALAHTGLTPVQIAQELGIARTEVELVIGFSRPS